MVDLASEFSPYTAPEVYRSMMLGTAWSPGTVTFSGHDREENWDNQKAKGTAGASSKLNGRDIGSFQATFYLADADEVAEWDAFQRVIESTTRGPTPVALPCYHPDLARNGYTDIVNAGVGGMLRQENGGATVQVKFQEFRPPAPKPAAKPKPKASAGENVRRGVGVSDDDPNYEAKEQLRQLNEEAMKP